MTKAEFPPAVAVLVLALLLSGCGREVDPFPEPGNVTEKVSIHRHAAAGPIVVVFTPYPIERASPPDGVRRAAIDAAGRRPCSIAFFHWPERALAERWIGEQLQERLNAGSPANVVLAGHSLGATAAAETARDLMERNAAATISLLLTVDGVKPGKISSTAGVITHKLPGVKASFTAYDSAPEPDGRRLLRHVNYYQLHSSLYHGVPMPGAENRLLSDPSGMLNHGNADDFAMPLAAQDILHALNYSGLPGGVR